MRRTWRIFLGLLVQVNGGISGIIGDFFWISLFLYFSPQISLIFSLSNATLRGSHGLSTRRARRTKSSRPEGPPRLPVLHNVKTTLATNKIWSLSSEHALSLHYFCEFPNKQRYQFLKSMYSNSSLILSQVKQLGNKTFADLLGIQSRYFYKSMFEDWRKNSRSGGKFSDNRICSDYTCFEF